MMQTRRFWGALAAVLAAGAGAVATAVPPANAQTPPVATIEPATDLADGTLVTLTIDGLSPDSWVEVTQCRSGGDASNLDCDSSDYGFSDTDASGQARVALRVDALIDVGDDESDPVDCRAANACVLGWWAGNGGGSGSVPLPFTPGGALAPPPTVSVSPDEGLVDRQSVTVSASGLVWSTEARIQQCTADPVDLRDCGFDNDMGVPVAEDGTYEGPFDLAAIIETSQGVVDCREPDACVLVASQSEMLVPAKTATTPLAFDPDGEVVPATITVEPDEDLVDGQRVTITGEGFYPYDDIGVRLCSAARTSEACEWVGYVFTDEDGTIDEPATAYAVLETPNGAVDCRTEAEPCELVIGNGSPGSPLAAHAALRFDPDGPLLPVPEITVEPATDLPEEATVTVTGTGFPAGGDVGVMVCPADSDDELCNYEGSEYVVADAEGEFSAELPVAATYHAFDWSEDEEVAVEVDCRAAPGCEVVAQSYEGRARVARAALAFAPEPPEGDQRYIDRVFAEVDVTHDVVYRDGLTFDIYEPKGDTADKRPAVMWMHGGWFDSGNKADMASYATEFARRGYVAVTVDYGTLDQLDTTEPQAIKAAMLAAYDNAAAAVAALHEHAGHYRIDPEAIAVGGAEAGATNAFDLAYLPGEHGRTGANDIAAALAIAGVSLGTPDEGDVPVMAFNASDDNTAPLHMAQWTCADAVEVDAACESVAYQGSPGQLEFTKQRDIVRRSAQFLADEVLEPLGYFGGGQGTTTSTEHQHTSTSGGGSTTSHGHTTSTTPGGGGNLPKTGSDTTLPLVLVGLGLTAAGAGLVLAARHRRRSGAAKLPGVAAGLLFIAVAIPVLSHDASAQEPPHEHPTTTVSTPPSEPTVPSGPTTTHEHPTTTVPATTTSTTGPTTTHHGGGGPGFPPEWTPDQVAYANQLIDQTATSLARFDTQAVLPLMGYTWIFDGTAVDTYQHWISVNRIGFQGSTIDPTEPESLVYLQTADGPELQAAMYILGANHVGVDSVPEELKYLPDWHVHENLCAEGFPPRLVGLTDAQGNCVRGYKLVTPPMLHVWPVETPCGHFAGVDEGGLICDHHPH